MKRLLIILLGLVVLAGCAGTNEAAVKTDANVTGTLALSNNQIVGLPTGQNVSIVINTGDNVTRMQAIVYQWSTNFTAANATFNFTVPRAVNLYNLTFFDVMIGTPSSSGASDFNIWSSANSSYLLSANTSIPQGSTSSYNGTTGTIDATYQTVVQGQQLRVDVLAAGTGVQGLEVYLHFTRQP